MSGGDHYIFGGQHGFVVGHGGIGTMNHTGGALVAQTGIQLGRAHSPTVTGSGTYDLSGTATALTQLLSFGSAVSSEPSTNTFNLSGGILWTVQMQVLNPNANNTFNWTGGTLVVFATTMSLTNNGGTFSPGDGAAIHTSEPRAGFASFLEGADYVQTPAGTFQVDIGAANSFDTVYVDGLATINGFINVRMLNGYEPNFGDTFDVLTSTNPVLGAPIAQGMTAGGKTFVATPVGNVLRLTVVPEPCSAGISASVAALICLARRSPGRKHSRLLER
jgi:hypothetical protein